MMEKFFIRFKRDSFASELLFLIWSISSEFIRKEESEYGTGKNGICR